ncbi:MAG: AsmA family protein [Bacteroidales bacterium]|nr:AsmA family protein [Bacteroidales bacterium]
MKKLLKILSILVVVLIALLIAIPYLFKDDIIKQTESFINENVNARVEFEDVRFSMFKRFPDLNVGMNNMIVSGIGQFESDTLVRFESFDAEVDLFSVFGKNIAVEGVYLIQPRVHAKVAADSSVNWDITKPSGEVEEELPDTAAATTGYRVDLKTFRVEQGRVIYEDNTTNMRASLKNLDFELQGDLGADSSAMNLALSVEPVDFKMGAIQYLNQADAQFEAVIGANLAEGRYHLHDNRFTLNGLSLDFDGLVEMLENGRINTDIAFTADKTDFKSLLSLVPAIYMRDFRELETSGQLSLHGNVSGYYKDSILPSVDMNLQVENAMFSYPDLPRKAKNIAISLQTFFDGKQPDNTKVNLERFHIELAGSPFDASFHLMTPVSDPTVDGKIDGQIVLDNLADVVPMENSDLRGTVTSDLRLKGSLSMIERERYDAFQAEGTMNLKDFYFDTRDLPAPMTMNADMVFTPQYLNIKQLDAKIGESDLHFSGNLSNYLHYMLKDGVIRGDFKLSSNYLNTNRFLAEDEVKEVSDTGEVELSLFKVPERVDFKVASSFEHILYDKMDIRNARGTILVRGQKIYLDDFDMDLFDGQLAASGEYSTRDTTRPYVNFNLGVQDLQIENALQTFRIIDTIAPIIKRAKGDISMDLEYTSDLQHNMYPVMESITGFGELRSEKIRLQGSRSFGKVLSALKLTKSEEQSFENIRINFILREGKLIVKPFDVRFAGMDMTISGSQSYKKTMDYLIDMEIPRSAFGGAANQAFDNLVSVAASKGLDIDPGETVNVKANLKGEFSDPDVGLSFGKGSDSTSVKEQVKQTVKETIDKKKEKAEEQVQESAAQKAEEIIASAEKKAEKIRAEARKAAQKIQQEADKKAERILEEAEGKNFLVRQAAEKSAEKVRQEADKRAEQLINEADKKAENIIQQAREKVEKIKKEN